VDTKKTAAPDFAGTAVSSVLVFCSSCFSFARENELGHVSCHIPIKMSTTKYGTESLTFPSFPFAVLVQFESALSGIRFLLGQNPAPEDISTSYVERQNLTMRMGMRRFTRLTNAHSKKIQNHEASNRVALHALQFLPHPPEPAGHTGNGSRCGRSRLDFGRSYCSNRPQSSKMNATLRWVLFLPAAVAAWLLVQVAVSLGSVLIPGVTIYAVRLFNGWIAGVAFVIAGAFTAPKNRLVVAISLASVDAIVSILMISIHALRRPDPIWDVVSSILEVAGTIVGCSSVWIYQAKNHSPDP
jgi:hypothetical protein